KTKLAQNSFSWREPSRKRGVGIFLCVTRECCLQEKVLSFDDVFRDYQSHYFRGSFADRVEPRISPVPMHIEFIRISITSMYLNRLVADSQSMLASEDFGLGSFRFERFSLVFQVCCSVDHHSRRVDIRQHVRKFRLYHLEV